MLDYTLNPDRNSSFWIKVNHDTLLSNAVQAAQRAEIIDLSLPLFRQLWPHIEEDMVRAGIKGVTGSSIPVLLSASAELERILKPGSRQSDKGYARAGIVPVLSSASECLALSNLAQSLDQRMPFLLHVRSTDSDAPSGDWSLESICEKVPTLPMLDLAGFYLRFAPAARLIGYFKRLLHTAESVNQRIICPSAASGEMLAGVSYCSMWENLAIDTGNANSFPLEIGCWAYPVRTGADYQVFQADIGRLHGLPEDFPALIEGEPAKLQRITGDFCEFATQRPLEGPFPARVLLTGGSAYQSIELREWRIEDLKNLLGHIDNCPVYLQKKERVIEIIP